MAAETIGERLQSSGILHVPGVGAGGISLQGATTPVLETVSGRRVIIDPAGTIPAGDADAIERLWPVFSVLQPPAGADLREVIGSMLAAARYHSVLRSAPLTFGRGVTVRLTPDFVVLRSESDLLEGELRAISVVDPAEAVPAELRELAGELRIRIVELTGDGFPAGPELPPARDPTGRVTTMETGRLAPLMAEIAAALGLAVERRGAFPLEKEDPAAGAVLRISSRSDTALIFEKPDPATRDILADRGETVIVLNSSADLTEAIGALLRGFGRGAIGPAVELFRTSKKGGGAPHFVIEVPGWLTESDGRRLLISGASLPPLVRLFLTREGIDIFEYRLRY